MSNDKLLIKMCQGILTNNKPKLKSGYKRTHDVVLGLCFLFLLFIYLFIVILI